VNEDFAVGQGEGRNMRSPTAIVEHRAFEFIARAKFIWYIC